MNYTAARLHHEDGPLFFVHIAQMHHAITSRDHVPRRPPFFDLVGACAFWRGSGMRTFVAADATGLPPTGFLEEKSGIADAFRFFILCPRVG